MKVSDELLDKLNHLLHRSRDAQRGYVETSNHVNSPEVRKWMIEYSDQRAVFCTNLATEIKLLGGDSDNTTSVLGEIHRLWIDLKGQWSDEEPLAMLEECKRGEETALEDYQEVLEDNDGMPASTSAMLNRHTAAISRALAQINILIDMSAAISA